MSSLYSLQYIGTLRIQLLLLLLPFVWLEAGEDPF